MAYEIDFLTVGDPGEDGRCSKSGDAIALRYGNLSGPRSEQTVVIVDGGFASSGEALVEHVKKYYGTDVFDFVISSHPHEDHIRGLFKVIESLRVGALLMHKPWEHAPGVRDLIDDSRTTHTGTRKRLKDSFAAAYELYQQATRRGITVQEPFQGVRSRDGVILFLGPSVDFYERCITADLADEPLSGRKSLVGRVVSAARAALRTVKEGWDQELLAEPDEDAVEPMNHSSTIIRFDFGQDKALLTADAGVQALNEAANYAELYGIDLKKCSRIQIPHHGSKRNVGPEILNRLIGPVLPQGTKGTKAGMLSAAKDGEPKHPSARVTNAFFRRGAPGCGTADGNKLFHSPDAPPRAGYSPVPSIPFRESYQEEE